MLILVAVTVRTVVQSGLFGHASQATSGYSMHEAREQLGTTLAGAMAEKYTNTAYNETDYLNKYITDNLPGSKVVGDIAIVDGWAFELDRSVPKIGQDLGKEGSFTYPDLKLEKGTLAEDKLSIPIIITARESEHGISKIEVIFNGNVIETFDDCNNSTEEIVKTFTATENGDYSVKVYSEINRTGYIKIDEIVIPSPQIGDYVRYTPDTADNYTGITAATGGYSNQSIPQDTTLKWRIMSLNSDGTVDLVANRPITTFVYFQGALGYNNGVYLLNDLCKAHYSNSSLGTTARSINLLDIEKHFNDAGRAARNAYTYDRVQYGNTRTYTNTTCTYTPDIYKQHDKNVTANPNNIAQLECLDYYSTPTTIATPTHESSLTVMQTAYYISSQASYYDAPNFHNLIFGTGTDYWLASRCVNCHSSVALFGLHRIKDPVFNMATLFCSDARGTFNAAYAVRPAVELPAKYTLKLVPGTTEWEIVCK